MIRFFLVIVALLQPVISYQHGLRPSTYELPENNLNKYINFDNFDNILRSRRQSGFDWDSPSEPFRQNNFNNLNGQFNGVNWNSGTNNQNDGFIFEDELDNRNFVGWTTPKPSTNRRRRPTTRRPQSTTVAVPGMGTPRTPCEDSCLSTPEYNPVCGDDGMTYFTSHRLACAQKCGKRVKLLHPGACARLFTPPPRG